jgi:MSHA biogenesis protein MshI
MYFQKLHFPSFFKRGEANISSSKEICCIDFSSNSFSLCYAKNENNKLNLLLCETYAYSKIDDLQESLSTLVNSHQLNTANCTWILQSDQYQSLLIEALPVPANEFQAAIRWKIKDLIRFPLEDILVDSYPLPIKKPPNSQEMTMIVVAKQSELKTGSDQLKKTGLNINKISIPEISLRNIAALYDQEDKSTALIYMQEKTSQLIITSKHLLHFTRRIEIGVDFFLTENQNVTDTEVSQKVDKLALEIQRSFDYYQSQWRQPLPARIIFSSVRSLPMDIAFLLSQRLTIPVEILNIENFFTNTKNISTENQGKYLLILGGLFNEQGYDNAARH